ncbi:Rv1733c family protein [Geodermatophilus marinus]|uniref:Rv1733c family protein n=1 Tax=Geodermatophilus sp. LHW52908 TaxID=2303986 RepID=UPI000E3DF0B4|nr:hypothetical protein [Geodermatophilus sp. LHW52908]RFU20450.1 hypothetical protein D0Z06_16385 [Geodermatophilus sp. LHW52908]
MTAPTPGPAGRAHRRLGLVRRPLRRGSDRAEAASWVLLALLLLLTVPVALTAGTLVHEQVRTVAEDQARDRLAVTAVATRDATARVDSAYGGRLLVAAEWTAPDGRPAEGDVPVTGAVRAGDRLTVWLTADGEPAGRPMTAWETTRSTVVLTGLGWVASVAVLVALHAVVLWLVDRHRDRTWTREWAAVEPGWSRRVP